MKKNKILTIIGARPQFIKVKPLSDIFKKDNTLEEIIVHTGQHYDYQMSKVFFNQLKLPCPKHYLNVNQISNLEQVSLMLLKLKSIMIKENPRLVIVYGDTNSTLAGALAAKFFKINLCHIEAGLRSYNPKMQEENNRILTDKMSDILCVPVKEAIDNLKKEGIVKNVFLTGDTLCDMLHKQQKDINKQFKVINDKFDITKGNYFFLTLHRRENIEDSKKLGLVLKNIQTLSYKVVFSIHPHTNKKINEFRLQKFLTNISCIGPQDYLTTLALIKNSKAVLTDSGGIQREAYMLKKFCFTLRDESEWRDTITSGWNQLIKINAKSLNQLCAKVENIRMPNSYKYLFGKGNAAIKIYEIIKRFMRKNEI
ncbi:MAG: UDP-N-acetylglucosamine 2-epimerase (non-hydrolyzing) [Candidatus Omnitrophota bacterium]